MAEKTGIISSQRQASNIQQTAHSLIMSVADRQQRAALQKRAAVQTVAFYALVALHGGEIRVASTPVEGSTFKVILPLPNRGTTATAIKSTGAGQS